uniref:branched-chain-amino-acid transaminase n=1 Tax=Desulfobacca acetoxidans TaxID=60893 RepID=A0A7V4LDL5_9BACT
MLRRLPLTILAFLVAVGAVGSQEPEISFKKLAVFPFAVLSKTPMEHLGEKVRQEFEERLKGEGFTMVSQVDLVKALQAPDERVREGALRVAASFLGRQPSSESLAGQFRTLSRDGSLRVRYQLALALGQLQHPGRGLLLAEILAQDTANPWMQTGVLCSVPPDAGELRDAVQRVLLAARTDEARVRLTVTTGSLHAEAADTPRLTVVATASPGQKYPPECYTKGVTVIASDYRVSRFDPTLGHKTTSYFSRLAMLRVAHLKGAFEALVFTDDDLLTEGAISNVFVVRNEELWTPPVDTPILPGITRAAVIEVARELGLAVREMGVTLDDVLSADEVFLTGSMMEVVPVVRIERQAVAQEKIGDVTRQIGLAYARLVDQECPV